MKDFFTLLMCELRFFTDYKNRFYQFIVLIEPLIFLTIIKCLSLVGHGNNLSSKVIAVAVLNIWSYVLYSSGSAFVTEKWAGTIDYVVNTSTSLFRVVMTKVVSNSIIGIFPFVLTLLYAKLFYGFDLQISNVQMFIVNVIVLVISLTAIGNILAVCFVLLENVYQYQNLVVYPIMLVCGAFYPVTHFPLIIKFIAYCVPMTWAILGMNSAISGPGTMGLSFIALAISVAYFSASWIMIRRIGIKFRESTNLGVI